MNVQRLKVLSDKFAEVGRDPIIEHEGQLLPGSGYSGGVRPVVRDPWLRTYALGLCFQRVSELFETRVGIHLCERGLSDEGQRA